MTAMKRLCLVLFVFAFAVSCLPHAFAYSQDDALDAYKKLSPFLTLNRAEGEQWPAEYAGCYINDRGRLVICLTDMSEEIQARYSEACGEGLRFQKADYSMSEMNALSAVFAGYEYTADMRAGYSSQYNRIIVRLKSERSRRDLERFLEKAVRGMPYEDTYEGMIEYVVDKTWRDGDIAYFRGPVKVLKGLIGGVCAVLDEIRQAATGIVDAGAQGLRHSVTTPRAAAYNSNEGRKSPRT